jgi:hypothetical protein
LSEDQPQTGIVYSEKSLAAMSHRLSRLKPVEPGDVCCNCGGDCDDHGFAVGNFHAVRVNGHPICARGKCYDAQMKEYTGGRDGCRCGATARRKKGEHVTY